VKRFVNGVEVELAAGTAEVTQTSDRLMVRSADGTHSAVAVRIGDTVHVSYRGQIYSVEKARRVRAGRGAGDGEMRAPMPGLIVDILVAEGDSVSKGDKILVLEAMKTQQAFNSPFDGTVVKVTVTKGQQVAERDLLAMVAPVEEPS
jgi:3-methylcrotonyl-CoA carboxylase alpha subunit